MLQAKEKPLELVDQLQRACEAAFASANFDLDSDEWVKSKHGFGETVDDWIRGVATKEVKTVSETAVSETAVSETAVGKEKSIALTIYAHKKDWRLRLKVHGKNIWVSLDHQPMIPPTPNLLPTSLCAPLIVEGHSGRGGAGSDQDCGRVDTHLPSGR